MFSVKKICIIVCIFSVLCGLNVVAELYNRAPDVMPGTIPEMRTTRYWIDRMEEPDEVILTHDAIERLNERYDRRVRSDSPFEGVAENRMPDIDYWWPGRVLEMPDLRSMQASAVADTVRSRINIQIDYPRKQEYGNTLAVKYSDKELDEFVDEMALDKVKNTVKIRKGITVRTTRIRNVPSVFPHQVGLCENAKTRWDLWNISIVRICTPITVLHPSRSGEYVLIACDEGYGWVKSEDVAFGIMDNTIDNIDDFANPASFIVCSGDRIQYYSDPNCLYASGWIRMGDRLPLLIGEQVKVPVRDTNGQLKSANAFLRKDAHFSRGWLPYTRRNIVETAFRLLDNTYDWTGGWFGRQHEATYRDIFSVFGFRLPWHGALFTIYGETEMVVNPDMGRDEQYRKINENDPFVTIQSCGGHAQLYLGEYNGTPIVLDQHGYGYEDENGTYVEVRRCCIGDVTMPTYFLTRNVTFCELK